MGDTYPNSEVLKFPPTSIPVVDNAPPFVTGMDETKDRCQSLAARLYRRYCIRPVLQTRHIICLSSYLVFRICQLMLTYQAIYPDLEGLVNKEAVGALAGCIQHTKQSIERRSLRAVLVIWCRDFTSTSNQPKEDLDKKFLDMKKFAKLVVGNTGPLSIIEAHNNSALTTGGPMRPGHSTLCRRWRPRFCDSGHSNQWWPLLYPRSGSV